MVTMHIIDDELMIRDLFKSILSKAYNIKIHQHWETCKPIAGEIVLHDIVGIGKKPTKVDGVRYLVCSGSNDDLIDIPKPWIGNLLEIIERKLKQ